MRNLWSWLDPAEKDVVAESIIVRTTRGLRTDTRFLPVPQIWGDVGAAKLLSVSTDRLIHASRLPA